MRQEFGALTKSGKTLGVRSFYMILFNIFHLPYLARQTHSPDATSLHPDAVPQLGTRGSYVEKHSDKHWLASHLVRAPNSRSGGREFKSPPPCTD
jgi:hypothetical protein